MTRFQQVFSVSRPVIGMVHLGAPPGSPVHNVGAGLEGLVAAATGAAVCRDLLSAWLAAIDPDFDLSRDLP